MNNENEKMISMYDPVVDAYRDVPISRAKELIKSAKQVEMEISKIKAEIGEKEEKI